MALYVIKNSSPPGDGVYMLKLIVGVKGTGKTKNLINLCNTAADSSSGCVVCIEKGTKLIHEIQHNARLINTEDYKIENSSELAGFVAGCFASNHDITNIFIDSALKICGNDMASFVEFVKFADKLCAHQKFDLTMTSSIPVEEVPKELASYIE